MGKVKRHNWDKSRSNFDIKLRLKRVVKGRHWMHNAQHNKQWEAIQDVRKRIKNNTL